MLRQQLWPVAAGAVAGATGSLLALGMVERFLFGVHAADPRAYAVSMLLVFAVSVAAGVIALRPLTRLQPTVLLRARPE